MVKDVPPEPKKKILEVPLETEFGHGKYYEAGIQFMNFKYLTAKSQKVKRTPEKLQELRNLIKEAKLQKLEDFIGLNVKKLKTDELVLCDVYNDLINKINNPDLTYEEFDNIMNSANNLIFK